MRFTLFVCTLATAIIALKEAFKRQPVEEETNETSESWVPELGCETLRMGLSGIPLDTDL